jgi:hypothetical protein
MADRALLEGVVPEDVIVFVWNGRAENEFGIGQRFEFDRLLDGSQAAQSRTAVRQGSTRRPTRWRPRGRCVPLGARQGRRGRARWIQGGRALERRHIFRGLGDTYGRARFEFGRQPDPVQCRPDRDVIKRHRSRRKLAAPRPGSREPPGGAGAQLRRRPFFISHALIMRLI